MVRAQGPESGAVGPISTADAAGKAKLEEQTGGGLFLERCRAVLQETFGFPTFRAGQEEALGSIGEGHDCLVVMPTGSGKSLCYQVPALAQPGVTLVVSPLIALMKDQVDGLEVRGARVTFVNSSLSLDEQGERLERMVQGDYKLVYVAPERFRSRAFQGALSRVEIGLLAVDEAHCISQWGHDFRPDYRRLRAVREFLGHIPVLALTATATPDVQEDIVRELDMRDPVRILTGFDRPNLSFRVTKVRGAQAKDDTLVAFLNDLFEGSDEGSIPAGIIYAGTRRHTEEVADFLDAWPWPRRPPEGAPICRAYHAGLDQLERRTVQEDFMEGRLPWVVATNAFGMGVDKADIRFVTHYDLPGSIEAYYQEVGRAGRDGLPAECLLLFAEEDRRLQEFFIEGNNPSREVIRDVHEFLWQLSESPIYCTLQELQLAYEETPALTPLPNAMAFRSAVVVLERAGALDRLDHCENLAELQPVPDQGWEANPYGQAAPVKSLLWESLRRVFARSEGESAAIRLENWASDLELELDSLRRGLANLAAEGWITYIPPFRGRAIRLPGRRRSLEEIGIDFAALQQKRRREEERLEKILQFARARQCRRDLILEHFGETIREERCGRCDACRTARGALERRHLTDEELTVAKKILSGIARARGQCGREKILRMLVGSKAREIIEFGLDQLSTYGILSTMKTALVREIFEQLEAAGCIRQIGDRYPRICLSERGIRVMTGGENIQLAIPERLLEPPRAAPLVPAEELEHDEPLFQRLRHVRREIAEARKIPAFRVFNDRTLKAMARERPRTSHELLAIPGVGEVTLELFGKPFLRELCLEEDAGEEEA